MKYTVLIKNKCRKAISKLSEKDRYTLMRLIKNIETSGPVQPNFMNYSKLSKMEYHCHLSYHWVACWRCEDGKYIVEVYYVGSRESAPY